MPYIKNGSRKVFDKYVEALQDIIESKGELNYVITRLVVGILIKEGINYNNLSDMCSVLNDVVSEVTRRLMIPYENIKIEKNGDLVEFEVAQRKIEEMKG